MSRLSEFLRAHMTARGLTQKDVAATFLDELQRRAGERAVSWPTVEPKLSKLVAGSNEGEKFFFDGGPRLAALGAALEVSEEELRALAAARTLLLHPGLPTEVAGYLRTRADAAGARHWIDDEVVAGPPEEVRVALRDRAQRFPRSLVVLPDGQDQAFFDGADVRTSTVESVPRGWLLVTERDLVTLPPPPEPLRFEGDEPLFPCPSLAEEMRRHREAQSRHWSYGREPRIPDRCERADLEEREPTFTLAEIAAHRRHPERARIVVLGDRRAEHDATKIAVIEGHESIANRVFAALHRRGRETFVWTWRRHVFVVGPDVEQVRELLGGDRCPHPLEEPATFADWRLAFDTWNPWGSLPYAKSDFRVVIDVADRIRFLTLAARTQTECGLDLRSCSNTWWERATKLLEPTAARAPSEDVDREVRSELRALAVRDHELAPVNASVIFRLQAAAEAPLVDLGCTGRDRFHVLANLGAGHLLRIRCVGYPDEKPEPLRGSRSLLVGGDVTIFLEEETDLVLEADPLAAVRRRKREAKEADEARRRRDAIDDDDD